MPQDVNSRFLGLFEKQQKAAIALRKEGFRERSARLKSLYDWILSNRSAIHRAVYEDFQKSPEEVDISELYPVLTEIRKARKNLKQWMRPKKIDNPITFMGSSSEVYFEPKGTSLVISPWNYPFQLAVGPTVSSIAAGNTTVIKPSEFTPRTSALISRMVEELFDERILTVVEGDHIESAELLKLPFDHIFFTGSPRVGKIVMEAASKHLTSVTLELGGKSPAIVEPSADLNDTAEKIAWGKWLNAGQTCVAPDYVMVHESRVQEFVKLVEKHKDKLYNDEEKYTGIVSDKHAVRLKSAIDEAVEKGAKCHFGGEMKGGKLSPVLLTNVSEDTVLMKEEIFGPVLPVMTYRDLTEAINYIQARPKPLALYHFSKKNSHINKVKQQVSAGTVCINDCVVQFIHPELPIGGVNNSGIGKAHGHAGFLAFSNEKAVVKQRTGYTMAKTLYPPFDKLKKITIEMMLKYL